MKKALLFFCVLFQMGLVAQSQQYINANYGREFHERPLKCIVQNDSTVLMLGVESRYDYVLYKVKANGDTIFSKYANTHDFYFGIDLIPLPGGGVIIPGSTGGIVRLDPNGNVVWTKMPGRFRYNAGLLIDDTTFAVVGSKAVFSHMQFVHDLGMDSLFIDRVYVGLYHTSGKLLNEKVFIYGSDSHEEASSIINASNGTLMVSGNYYRYEPGNWTDYFLLTLAPDLSTISNIVHSRTASFGIPKFENSKGNFMNCGSKTVNAAHENDIFIQELNANGDILWEKTYDLNGNDYGVAMLESEGFYYVAGGTGNKKGALPEYDNILLKLDLKGDTVWTKTYALPGIQEAVDIKELNDSTLVIFGSTDYQTPCPAVTNPGYICADFYLMYIHKETGHTNFYPAPQPLATKNQVLVYPNPAKGKVNVQAKGVKSVLVRNAIGKELQANQRVVSDQELEISGLGKGIYFLLIETETGFENKRVVVM